MLLNFTPPLPRRDTEPSDRAAESYGALPTSFLAGERKIISARRRVVNRSPHAELVGLALSGGGVRSATFNLGVLQAFATHHALRVVDYLSTVSGGGYIGSFLGRFYTRFLNRPDGAVDVIEARLRDVNSPEISWLRQSSEYVAAASLGDAWVTKGIVLRAFLTVHCIVGVVLIAIFNSVNLFRYGAFPALVGTINPMLANVTRLSVPVQVQFPDPWLLVFAVVVVAWLMPLAIAFWLPSDSPSESYQRATLAAFLFGSAAGFMLALRSGAWLVAASVFITTVGVFFWMELAWSRAARRVPGSVTNPIGRLLVRNQLTKWLAVAVSSAALSLGVWMLDDMVLRLYRQRPPWREIVPLFAVALVLLLGPLRWLARWLLAGASDRGTRHGGRWRVLTNPVLPVVLGLPLLIGWSFISHAMFRGGADVSGGFWWTLVAWGITAILSQGGIFLVNLSSAHSQYAARGSRAYLGASNPYRHATDVGADVTSPELGDDMPFEKYRPDLAGGPVHIINVFANQSLDRTSGRRTRGRQGENMAVGPIGVSFGPASHAKWDNGPGCEDRPGTLIGVGWGDLPDPFTPRGDSATRRTVVKSSELRLSEWMALSGAPLTPGTYADTRLGTSLLYGLSNVRAGFWWDSGIEDGKREGERLPSTPGKFARWLVMRRCRAQRLLLNELMGRYHGPWRRYWYLSDGGHGDDLGIYELVRRRVPIIICADATRDIDGGLAALANAIRKVRVDFGATIEFLSASDLNDLAAILAGRRQRLPEAVIDAIGTLDDVRPGPGARSRKHAALGRIRYENVNTQSVFLYIKATMTGDEPPDVLEYHREHPHFPHQSVFNQFLDEAQWESYRELGLHCTSPLFTNGADWLADVRRAL